MKTSLVTLIILFNISAFADSSVCLFKSKSKDFGELNIPRKLTVTALSKDQLSYQFKLKNSGSESIKKCDVPHNGVGGVLDTPKRSGWFKYGYGSRELDECLDAYAEVPKLRKNKPWKLELIAQHNGGATAIYFCGKKPKFTDEQ